MPSLMFDKLGFSLVPYESCRMDIEIPPLSLNSWAHCRWNASRVMILGLQRMSCALSVNDILGCCGHSCLSGLCSDIFDILGS